MRNDKPNMIVELTEDLAVNVVNFCRELSNQKHYNLSSQLFKSGTSIGANTVEAQNAESKADFIHKMKISAKEADETAYWLRICKRTNLISEDHILHSQTQTSINILSKIISTTKKSINKENTHRKS